MEPQRTFTPHGAPIRDGAMLPVQPPAQLVGRSREIAAMQSTLKIGAAIFLSGGAGLGKTALAAMLSGSYTSSNGGVLWLNAYEDDFDTLLARVGRAYSLLPSASTADSTYIESIRSVLERNQPLIVLDGIVDINAAREFVRSCATGIPLIIANEFAGAGPWTPIELGPLSQEDSQDLFKQISRLTDSLYQDDIIALCRFLSGNPLAIELAARLVLIEDITPAELLASLPTSTGHDGHLLMMTLAFRRLQPSAQALLLVLAAMFTGSASVELLGDISDVPALTIVPLMQMLVVRGIARESTLNGQLMYSLHEVAQQYTRNWLSQYQHLHSAENRALRAVLKFVERHTKTRIPGSGFADLAAEMPNVMAAAAFATQSRQAGLLAQLIDLLDDRIGNFVETRGFQPEMSQLRKLNALLTPATPKIIRRNQPNVPTVNADSTLEATQQAAQSPESLLDSQATPIVGMRSTPPKPVTLPPSHEDVGDTQSTQVTPSNPMPAVDDTQPNPRQDESAVELGDTPTVSEIQAPAPSGVVITEPPHQFGDTDVPTERSLPNIHGQIDRARASGDTYTQANLLHAIGRHYAERGDPTQGVTYEKEALALYESVNDTSGILSSLDTLATITAKIDDIEGALLYATRGVNLAESAGDKNRLGRLQMRLADVRLALGDHPAAIQTYSQAAETLRAAEDWYNVGVVMSKLGTAFIEMRQFREGLMMLEQALVIFQKEQKTDAVGRVLGSIGTAYSGLDQWDQAHNYFMQALAVSQQNKDQQGEVAHLSNLAHARRMQGNIDGAIEAYRQALHTAYQLQDTHLQGEFSYELGSLLIEHPSTISMGLQLLREAEAMTHSDEAAQLIRRATKRVDRARNAGLPLIPAEDSRQYAAKGYTNLR